MKKIAVLLCHSPFDSAISREANDMIMALAAVEHQVTVIYQDTAVLQLLPISNSASLGCKDFTPAQKLFDLYEVAAVVACAASISRFNIQLAQCLVPVTTLSEDAIATLLTQQHHVLRF
jgi:tRNA 2-thiouridine synthesizing protein C